MTKHRAVFDHCDVIQTVADLSGDRLGADQVTALADAWLSGAEVAKSLASHVRADQVVLDLVNLPNRSAFAGRVEGLCW